MATRALCARLEKRARQAGVILEPGLAERLVAYFELLLRWNERINLTALGDRDEGIDRLLLEPLAALRYLPTSATSLMDIGSGGGSPAIPIKLARPALKLWMVESKTRKAAFLREVIRQLSLADTFVGTARYEELLAQPELHEAFDAVSVRAVRLERRLLMAAHAFLKPRGLVLLFRSEGSAELSVLPPPLEWVGTYALLESLRSRLLVLRKIQVGTGSAPGLSSPGVAIAAKGSHG